MSRDYATSWIYRHPFWVIVILLAILDGALLFALALAMPQTLRVSFLDVGQGDAVFIETPNGNQLLYDAGPPSGAVLRALGREMPFWDNSIDVAVLSHPDMDHIGGFPDVFRRYDIGVVLEPGVSSENGVYDETIRAINSEHAGHIIAQQGMSIDLGGGVVADILYPDHDTTGTETNSASVVLHIQYGDTSFLLSGDLPQQQEEYIVRQFGGALHANVLKIGHHGSRTSTSKYWLSAVTPDFAVISAGRANRYGHPHKEVTTLLDEMKIPTLITAQEGTITFTSDGEVVTRN